MSLSGGILYSYLLLSCHYHAGHLTYMLVLSCVFVVFLLVWPNVFVGRFICIDCYCRPRRPSSEFSSSV